MRWARKGLPTKRSRTTLFATESHLSAVEVEALIERVLGWVRRFPILSVEDPVAGPVTIPGFPFVFDHERPAATGPAPLLGEHNGTAYYLATLPGGACESVFGPGAGSAVQANHQLAVPEGQVRVGIAQHVPAGVAIAVGDVDVPLRVPGDVGGALEALALHAGPRGPVPAGAGGCAVGAPPAALGWGRRGPAPRPRHHHRPSRASPMSGRARPS
mgnify:CR=1 FL=1